MEQRQIEIETFLWHGQKRYQCPMCAFDSYSTEILYEHIVNIHKAEETVKVESAVLFDDGDGRIAKDDEEEPRIIVPDDADTWGERK
jgi:hypothetical protein